MKKYTKTKQQQKVDNIIQNLCEELVPRDGRVFTYYMLILTLLPNSFFERFEIYANNIEKNSIYIRDKIIENYFSSKNIVFHKVIKSGEMELYNILHRDYFLLFIVRNYVSNAIFSYDKKELRKIRRYIKSIRRVNRKKALIKLGFGEESSDILSGYKGIDELADYIKVCTKDNKTRSDETIWYSFYESKYRKMS